MPHLLEVQDLTTVFAGDYGSNISVDHVSFHVDRGKWSAWWENRAAEKVLLHCRSWDYWEGAELSKTALSSLKIRTFLR